MNKDHFQVFQKEYRRQYLAVFLVNITSFIFGIACGFSGPHLELFKSDASPLETGKITIEDESHITSAMAFGAIGFVLVFGWMSEKFGRKISILLIGIPQTASWVYMACATTVHHIFMSRFLSGIAGAGIFFVVPVYVAEISDKKIRGFLSTVISVVCNLGILVEFILADYVDFKDVAKVVVAISIIFVIGFAFMPESPQYLVSRTRVEEAEVAFKYYRGLSAEDELPQYLVDDFKAIREIGIANEDEVKGLRGILEHISKPGVLKGVFMTIVVTHFPVFSGCFVFITYNQGIFRGADLKILTVFWSSIAFAVIQMVASMITAKFVDRLGRRTILIWSAFSSALCLAVFAAYMYLKDQLGLDFTSIPWITWIPLLSFLLEVLTSNIGIISVPNFYAPEILDQKIRSSIFSFCSWWAWIVGFLQIRYYPYIELSIGLHGVMLVFSLLCVFCGTFTLFVLPETKGRTIEEIALSIIKQ